MDLVLASTSRWRAELLANAGIPCRAEDPGVDESAWVGDGPVGSARLRAAAKARAVAARHPGGVWVIGADQVIHLDGRAFGKPPDAEAHRDMLRALRGRVHHLVTAVRIERGAADGRGGTAAAFEVTSRLAMRADLTDREIDAYVHLAEARGCAGGYRVDARGIVLFRRIEGDWTNVVGLPVPRLVTALRRLGWRSDTALDPDPVAG